MVLLLLRPAHSVRISAANIRHTAPAPSEPALFLYNLAVPHRRRQLRSSPPILFRQDRPKLGSFKTTSSQAKFRHHNFATMASATTFCDFKVPNSKRSPHVTSLSVCMQTTTAQHLHVSLPHLDKSVKLDHYLPSSFALRTHSAYPTSLLVRCTLQRNNVTGILVTFGDTRLWDQLIAEYKLL